MHKRIQRILVITLISLPFTVFADVPVVDLSQTSDQDASAMSANNVPATTTASLSLDQRVALLEQQMNNLTQMNLPQKIDNLQQQLQQLNGQIEVQAHDIQTLDEQQKNFYQDLNQRLDEIKALVTTGTGSNNNATKTAKTDEVTASATDSTTTIGSKEEQSYQKAFDFLAAKQNDKAIPAFQAYLTTYPNGKYAVNAHYWLGEIYTVQNKTTQATNEFNAVISKYPGNPKIPDALLKLAIINAQTGKNAQAKQQLKKIIQQYPSSSAARLASMRLQQMKLTPSY